MHGNIEDSGTLALDLAMMYMAAETEAAKACFGPYKAFMDATSDVWKVVDSCRTAVEGSWSVSRNNFHLSKLL